MVVLFVCFFCLFIFFFFLAESPLLSSRLDLSGRPPGRGHGIATLFLCCNLSRGTKTQGSCEGCRYRPSPEWKSNQNSRTARVEGE